MTDDLAPDELPRPHYWHEGNRRIWAFVLFCAFGLLVSLLLAAVRPVLALVLFLGFAAVALPAVWFGAARPVVVRTTTVELDGADVPATLLPYRRLAVRLGWLVLGALGVAGVLLLVRGELVVGGVPLVLSVAGGVSWWVIHRDRGGNRPGLALCEPGVVLVRGRTELIGWDELAPIGSARVHPVLDPLAGRLGRDVIVVRTKADQRAQHHHPQFADGLSSSVRHEAGGTGPYLYAHRLRCDPVVVYHALRFYLAREGTRAELGTVAAANRIRARDLLV